MKKFLERVWEYSLENPQGFTLDLDLNSPQVGFCIGRKETQNNFGKDGLRTVIEFAKRNNCYIGGWLNDEDNKYYFDAVMVVSDLKTAIDLAKEHNQKAILT